MAASNTNKNSNINGEELAFFVTAATNVLAKSLTADEMNIVGNALTLAGSVLMTIASIAPTDQGG